MAGGPRLQQGLFLVGVAEAGGAHRGAVAAGQAALGHLVPAGMLQRGEQRRRQVAFRQPPALHGRGPPLLGGLRCEFGAGGLPGVQRRQQLPAPVAAGPGQVAVLQLGEQQVIASLGMGAIAGRDAEAGVGGTGAVHRHQQQGITPGPVGGIGMGPLQEMPVLQGQGCQVAGAHAEHGCGLGFRDAGLESEGAGSVAAHLPEVLPGREQKRLQGLGTGSAAEAAAVHPQRQTVLPGSLPVVDPHRQVPLGVDFPRHHHPVGHRRAEAPVPVPPQPPDQGVQGGNGQVDRGGHGERPLATVAAQHTAPGTARHERGQGNGRSSGGSWISHGAGASVLSQQSVGSPMAAVGAPARRAADCDPPAPTRSTAP